MGYQITEHNVLILKILSASGQYGNRKINKKCYFQNMFSDKRIRTQLIVYQQNTHKEKCSFVDI